ncbi:hypothetical protein ABFX02_13G076800 [Erythranthe guttata]
MVSTDRLSDLPHPVLAHILSFLPTKISVRTSILARRWRFLWADVPTLHFEWEDRDFIDSVLSLHKAQNITTFRFTSNKYYFDPEFQSNTWITTAIDRNVQIIDLCFLDGMVLPNRLFSCETLVDLRLNSCGAIPNMCCPVLLPCLKILYLIYVRQESLVHLLRGCPVLEVLVIGLIFDHRCTCCTISSPTIKSLTLRCEFVDDLFFGMSRRRVYNHGYKVEIHTPALRYLHFDDCLSEHIVSRELASLIEADIYLRNDNKKRDDVLYSQSVLEFIDRLSNVKRLKLDLLYCTEIIDSVFSAWIISFGNLTKLELTADCRFLSKFLEYADNLEILIFWEVGEEIKEWREPEQVPTCLLSNLRTIMLTNIVGTKHDFEIVSYLLMNGKVLEKMEISYPLFLGSDEKTCVVEEILSFERGSEACELSFVEFV